MLEICPICTLDLQDESYPYIVPVNFGFTWDEKLVIQYAFLDRSGKEKYQNELQDYRSVSVFGRAELVTCDQPDEFLKWLNALQAHYRRAPIPKAPKTDKLVVVKIAADTVTVKAMYTLNNSSETEMPE